MSRAVNEKVLLVESLTVLPCDPKWDAVEASVTGRTDKCPPMGRLIDLSRRLLSATESKLICDHEKGCPYCRNWLRRFRHAQDAPPAPPVDAGPEPYVPVRPPAIFVVPAHSDTFASTFGDVKHPMQLLQKLRPVLPDLLADIGLSRDLDGRFQAFARASIAHGCPEGTVWLPWILERFAREVLGPVGLPRVLNSEDWKIVLQRCALRYLALQSATEHLDPRAAGFYNHLLDRGPIDWGLLAPLPQDQARLAEETDVSPDAVSELIRLGRRANRTLMAPTRKAG